MRIRAFLVSSRGNDNLIDYLLHYYVIVFVGGKCKAFLNCGTRLISQLK